MTLKKLSAGDKLGRISASTWNQLCDFAARASIESGEPASVYDTAGVVMVQNDTGKQANAFGYVVARAPLFNPSDGAKTTEYTARQLRTSSLSEAYTGRFAVPLDGIPDGKMGRAIVYGLAWVKLFVVNEAHRRADVPGAGAAIRFTVTGSGTPTANEVFTQSGTGATGQFVSESGGQLVLVPLSGTFNTTGSLVGTVTRSITGGSAILDEREWLRSGGCGEADILYKEPGVSGSGSEGNPLGLKWALIHVGRKVRDRIPAIIGAANATRTGTAGTGVRYFYDWQEAVIDGDPASATYGQYIAAGGIDTSEDAAFKPLRAVNRRETRHKTSTTHVSGEVAAPVLAGTVVELRPERDSRGNTVYVFDEDQPTVFRGIITAVAGASGSTPVVASGVTYSVRIVDKTTTGTISGVRATWGNPRAEADKIVPAAVGDPCLVAQFGDGGTLVWRALVAERIKATSC